MSKLFHDFYVQPMNVVYIEIAAMWLIWLAGMFILRGKARRITCVVFTVLAVCLVFSSTVMGRSSSGVREFSPIPFITFKKAKTEAELYRAMFMNVALFIPLGLSLPFALPERMRHKVVFTVIVGALVSIAVEVCQYVFCLGKCETDDVLMNTLGVLIGGAAYLAHGQILRLVRLIKTKGKETTGK